MADWDLRILTFAAELARCHMVSLLEYAIKVGKVIKSYFCGNIKDSGIGGGQKPGCHCKPIVPQIVYE